MRILLDTNIIILREDNKVIQEDLQVLMKVIQKLDHKIILHPISIKDINRDSNEHRRRITLSKFHTYDILERAPDPKKDSDFLDIIESSRKDNDIIDDFLIYAVYRNAVNFLITEDFGIHKKAKNINLSDRIFNIIEALEFFQREVPKDVRLPPALQQTTMASLNVNDPIFDSLRENYPNFNDWYTKKSRTGRKCWTYIRNNGSIGAIMIYKFENEVIHSEPPLKRKKRLKIATMKVSHVGHKIGELLIKLSVELSIKNKILEIYLTLFTRKNEFLVDLIEEYGFKKVSIINQPWIDIPEDIYLKKIVINEEDIINLTPIEISKKLYPNLFDGTEVSKHVIPIQSQYFNKLYTDYPRRQTTLNEHVGEFIIQGNTIKKAYLSHSSSKKMKVGDILLFYRSEDVQGISSIGVIESVSYGLTEATEILSMVGKRTVYSFTEIEDFANDPTTVILFNHHFHFKKPVRYKKLLKENILRGPPQSITEIGHENYEKIKKLGGIDERFTFN